MKRAVVFAAVAVVAMPLFAADPKPISTPQAQAAESPLVAAARRANRLGKKPAYVITNDNLVRTGGHFTTTDRQTPLAPAPPNDIIHHPTQSGETLAEKAKKAATEREKKMNQLHSQYEGDAIEDEAIDPAHAEQQLQQIQKVAPPPGDKKP
jgi:hypothetical protein